MKFTSDVVIGLEIHAELNTDTKLFCSCPAQGSDEPNTRTCPICLGMPGAKPVTNSKALVLAAKLAQGLNCSLAKEAVFSRKSYFYPDMSKNFQITQYEIPIGENGSVEVMGRKIRIRRVHLEEDPASLIHPGGMDKASYVLIDYNRSGNPLCEVVTEPDFASPQEARQFLKSLITILRYLDAFIPGKHIIKADANISIKETGYTRVEIKNITGFKEIERALAYEIQRQRNGEVRQETRSWNAEKGITQEMRIKETEEDYGYIFEPDLVPVDIKKQKIPEMPHEKAARFVKQYKLSEEDAHVITNEYSITELFEKAAKVNPVLAARWIRRELVRVLNYNNIDPAEMNIDEKQFISLLENLVKNKITEKVGQRIIERLAVGYIDVDKFIEEQGLETISDKVTVEKFVKEAIAENPKAVDDFKAGKETAFNFLLGAVMRKAKGKADPKEVRSLLSGFIK
jgi:aspartyl-tRNA(Asn)/glutamyl-tRNA(Gln) amidotransferase subunit B